MAETLSDIFPATVIDPCGAVMVIADPDRLHDYTIPVARMDYSTMIRERLSGSGTTYHCPNSGAEYSVGEMIPRHLAYMQALVRLEERAKMALVGPQGPQGIPGPAGAVGGVGAIGPTGLTGLTGLAGPMPTPAGAGWMEFLTAALGALRAIWPVAEGAPAVGPVPPAPPPVPPPTSTGGALEVITPGGTVDMPVIPGSRDDPAGLMRPIFPSEEAKKVALELYQLWLQWQAQRQAEERQKQARETAAAMQRAWMAYYAALVAARRRETMPFGQMGFQAPTVPTIGGTGAGFWGGVGDIAIGMGGTILADWLEDIFGGGDEPRRDLPAPVGAPWAPPGGQVPATYPPTGGYVPAQTAAGGGLFRSTVSRVVPRSEISIIGPDGKMHTWLHAVPKGWKINRCNVSGRRRRHHHHPR